MTEAATGAAQIGRYQADAPSSSLEPDCGLLPQCSEGATRAHFLWILRPPSTDKGEGCLLASGRELHATGINYRPRAEHAPIRLARAPNMRQA